MFYANPLASKGSRDPMVKSPKSCLYHDIHIYLLSQQTLNVSGSDLWLPHKQSLIRHEFSIQQFGPHYLCNYDHCRHIPKHAHVGQVNEM